jgi:hypothetical protein
LIQLLSTTYFNDAPEKIIVDVWDASKATRLKLNKEQYSMTQIQKNIIETIKETFNKPLKFYSQKFPFYSPVNFLTNSLNIRNYNSRANYFTPLTNKHNYFEDNKNIVAVDIETMFLNNTSRHVPVLITIAYFNSNNRLITNFFLINNQDIKIMVMNMQLTICEKIFSIIYLIILILHQ